MIVDTSAVAAIVFKEPGFHSLIQKLRDADAPGIGTPTLAETGIVLTARLNEDATSILGRLLQELAITPVAFGEPHWRQALRAFERFGKGRHKAGLNFGDCLSYATAKLSDQPLLCTGEDFSQTDLVLA